MRPAGKPEELSTSLLEAGATGALGADDVFALTIIPTLNLRRKGSPTKKWESGFSEVCGVALAKNKTVIYGIYDLSLT